VRDRDPLDAAGEIDRPGDAVRIVAADLLNDRELLRRELLVPPELLEHPERELRIAVLDLGVLGIRTLGEERSAIALHAEARAERAAAILHRQMGIVEDRAAGMPQLRRPPAGPRQPVDVAADFRVVPGGPQRDEVEFGLVAHVRLEALGRLAAIAGRPPA